ncbi:MAG: GyrI-like domain-containing protein [Chloroflexi bacterium]|nr:GyrI-like domain-containing protein [Chloroflexota bacterium]
MEVTLKDVQAQPVLYVRTRTSLDRLPQVIGESYHKIANYMQGLGEKPAGVPYTAYHNLDTRDMDVEMCFPVSNPLPGREEIKGGELAAGRVAAAMYKGPYAAMEAIYSEIFRWLAERGHQAKGVYYEYYYNSPQDVPESELLTEIVIPLK